MLPGKPSSRCALHHVLPSSSSLYLALSPFLWKHARKTTQWRKVKCKVSEAGRGGEKVSGVLPSQDSIFIGSAGWATDKTTRDACERTNKLTSTPHTPHLLHSRTPRWWQEMKQSTKKQTKEKKKNLPHHNSQTLLHGYGDLIHFTAAQMQHKSLWGDIWSPQLC